MFHNFDMGGDIRLVVKVSESRETREKRLAKKQEEEEFLGTLHCGKYGASEHAPAAGNGYELTEEERKNCEKNPFLPSYKMRVGEGGSPQDPARDGGGVKEARKSLLDWDRGGGSKPTSSLSGEEQRCTKCGKLCKQNCQRCRAPYCGRECQESDWGRHKVECERRAGEREGQQQQTDTQLENSEVAITEKQHSEDEGYDIPTPPIEELMDVLQQKPAQVKPGHSEKPLTPQRAEENRATLSLPILNTPSSRRPLQLPSPSLPSPGDQLQTPPPAGSNYCTPIPPSEVLEVFRTSGCPLPSLPLGCSPPQRFRGVVTSSSSCSRFSVVMMSVEVKLALMTIARYVHSSLPPADPLCLVVGSKVGFLDGNGELYRMEVTEMNSDLIQLTYHDLGGGVFQAASGQQGLVILPEDVVTLPCLQYRCVLQGSQDPGELAGGDQLMTTVRGHPVLISTLGKQRAPSGSSVSLSCTAQLPDGTDISTVVAGSLSGGQRTTLPAVAPGNPSPPVAPSNYSPAVAPGNPSPPVAPSNYSPAVAPGNRSPTVVPGNHSPAVAPGNRSPAVTPSGHSPATPTSAGKSAQQYKLIHMARDVNFHSLSRERPFVIVPQVVDSPSSIWAQVIHPKLQNLDWMQKDLAREYGQRKGQVYSPGVGEMVVVRHSEDQQFYRAEVLCVNNDGTADVRFVDFGDRETVLVTQVRHIQPVFLTLPIQALRFSLEGVAPSGHALSWGAKAIAYLKTKILRREVETKLVSVRQQVHYVSLSDPDIPGRYLAEEMVSNGLCVRSSPAHQGSSPSKLTGVRSVCLLESPKSPQNPPPLAPADTPTTPHSNSPPADEAPLPPPALVNGSSHSGDHWSENPSPPSRNPSSTVSWNFLPVGKEIEVLVSSAAGPTVFHVQKLDRVALTALQELTEKLNSANLEPLSARSKSEFCVARFSEDGLLYRAKLWKKLGSKHNVKFIDYGDGADVPVSDMYCLPPSCASLPAQGILCTLQNLRPLDQSDSSAGPSPQCIRKFRSLVENKRVFIKLGMLLDSNPNYFPKHIVELRDREGRSILDQLVEAGLASKKNGAGRRPGSGGSGKRGGGGKRNSGGGGKWGREPEDETSPQKPWGERRTENPPRSPPSGSIPASEKDTSPAEVEPPPPDYPPLSSLTFSELPSDKEFVEVVVTALSDLPTFFLQLATVQSHQAISNLQTELNSAQLAPPTPSPPSEGQVVCCKYPVDDVWYRAAVVEKRGNRCAVQFVDYGNKEIVPLSDLRPCPPRFLKQPILSVRCSLFGVHPPSDEWSPSATTFLQQYCERVLMAKLVSRDPLSGLPSVQLFDTSNPEDISVTDELIKAGFAVPAPTTPAPVAPASPAATISLPPAKLPREREFSVLALTVSSLTEIYIHPVTPDTPHYLSTFLESINEYCSSQATPITTPPGIGQYCLAFYDGSWYRAKVESFESTNEAIVFFVDYGNRDKVSLAQILEMPAQFTDTPRLVLKCALSGIEHGAVLEPDPAACALLSELSLSSKLTCRVVSHSPLLVDLLTPTSGQSLLDQLISAGKLPPLPPDTLFSVDPTSLGEEQAMATEVHGPGDFWVQPLRPTELQKLASLMEEIGGYCTKQTPPYAPVVLGQLCCARFSEDGVWYRARVIGFPSPSQYLVQFLDYGNREVCPVLAVLPATEYLLELPALAVYCALADWEGGEGGEGGERFKELVENKTVSVEVRGWEGGKSVVVLSGDDGPIEM